MKFNTALLHSPKKNDAFGATQVPIYQVSAFQYDSAEQHEKVFSHQASGYAYTRIGNPTVSAFEAKVNELEGGRGAVACASGMAAVSLALLNILKSGDEVIAESGLYGDSLALFKDFAKLGITVHLVPHLDDSIDHLINEKTRAIFGEVISNPSLDIFDIEEVAQLAHAHGIPLIVDATTASPYLISPLKHGADIVVHSSSKYINGGGNSISGVIVEKAKIKWDAEKFPALKEYAKYGPFAYLVRLRHDLFENAGACLSPFNSYLNMVGIETLGLRMQRICDNAYGLAKALDQLDVAVNYPGLESHPHHELAQKQLKGYGGILTFRCGSKDKAFQLIDHLQYACIASNIGDVRTLVLHPASTIFVHSDQQAQEAAGVYEDTVRVSVGIEDVSDLIEDFTNAILYIRGEEK